LQRVCLCRKQQHIRSYKKSKYFYSSNLYYQQEQCDHSCLLCAHIHYVFTRITVFESGNVKEYHCNILMVTIISLDLIALGNCCIADEVALA
jgi:hypothetical protein